MDKALRKCYKCLELSYNATEDDVITRQNAMVKILQSKRDVEKDTEEKISRVKYSAGQIIKNLKEHGLPKVKNYWFETKGENFLTQIIVLFFVAFIFAASLIIIL